MIVVLKRLAIWFVETAFEAILLALSLVVSYGPDQYGFARDTWFFLAGIGFFSFTAGYLLTTAVARVLWRGRGLLPYSILASLLLVVHVEILFHVANGWTPGERMRVRFTGLCVVLACTLCGSYFLRKWARRSGNTDGEPRAPVMSAR